MGRIHRGAGRRASELSNGIGVPGVQVFFACELCVSLARSRRLRPGAENPVRNFA